MASCASEPGAGADDERRGFRVVPIGAAERGGVAMGALPGNANIRREPARELVTQSQSGFDGGQAGADAAFDVVLAMEFGAGSPLQDQPVVSSVSYSTSTSAAVRPDWPR